MRNVAVEQVIAAWRESSISIVTSGCASSALISDANTSSRCDRGRRYSGFLPARSRASVNRLRFARPRSPTRTCRRARRSRDRPSPRRDATITSESAFDAELMAARDQPLAELPVVVDLAVEDQLDRAVFVGDRLVGRLAQIDDAQAAEARARRAARSRRRPRRDRGRDARSSPSSPPATPASTGAGRRSSVHRKCRTSRSD